VRFLGLFLSDESFPFRELVLASHWAVDKHRIGIPFTIGDAFAT
jgi:hypothetical protein